MSIVSKIISYENGEMTVREQVIFMAELIKTGAINGLQGSYQRYAFQLVEAGIISHEGEVDVEILDEYYPEVGDE